jgi:hypothetical protein
MRPVKFLRQIPALAVLLLPLIGSGQVLLDRSAFTVGATHIDPAGQNWAYLSWQSNDPDSLASATFAVYGKTGDADSTNAYTRRAVVRRQTDPQAISALLDRSVKLGFTLAELDDSVNALFRDALPAGNTFTLGQKLSTVFRTASPDKFQTLLGVGRLHAGFNMALGLGAAEPIAADATRTYEIREYDALADRDLGVLGRVTVTAGVNTPLPAPGPAFEVRDHPENDDSTFTSRTNLVIPLRWSTPEPLRRTGLAHYGYNVWRMTEAYAVANGFAAASPTTAQLKAFAALPSPPVRRVNRATVLSDKAFTNLNVDPSLRAVGGKFLDDHTILFTDDNGRQLDGTNAFADGDAFYYFITARDILGNDGAVSPPARAKACEIIPPGTPAHVKVDIDYNFDVPTNTGTQRLKISWDSAPNTGRQKTVRYHVYRWSSTDEMARQGRRPDSSYRIAVINHANGQARHEFIDSPPNPTAMVNDQGVALEGGDDDGDPLTDSGRKNFTWFYTVRAEDDFACHNFSPHSIAAYGTLRERSGPEAPTGDVLARCLAPVVNFVSRTDELYPAGVTEDALDHFVFECQRLDESIAWAEFAFFPNANADACVTFDPVRLLFPSLEKAAPGGGTISYVEKEVSLPLNWRSIAALNPAYAACRVATLDGRETAWRRVQIPPASLPENGHRMRLLFSATVQDLGYQPDCPVLITRPPGRTEVFGTLAKFNLTRGTREWRLHRQCDQGTLTLVKSGIATYNPVNAAANQIQYEDKELPFGVSEVCYWAEVVDRHGNSSSLQRLLPCLTVNSPPAPVLAPIIGSGTAMEPAMIVRFFCPSENIDHFEILLNDVPATLPGVKNIRAGVTLMPVVAKASVSFPFEIFAKFGGTVAESFKVSQTVVTGPVGTGDGSIGAGPLFSVTIPKLNPRVKQKLVVRAVTRRGLAGTRSNGQEFDWRAPSPTPPPAEDPCLPWPARNLPEIVDRTAVEPRIEALRSKPDTMPGDPTIALELSKRFPLALRVGTFTNNNEILAGHYPEGDFDPPNPVTPAEIAAAKEEIRGGGSLQRSFNSFLFTVPESKGSSKRQLLLPIIVYRTQVANPDFPSVSGDLVQVTPLIDRVAEKVTSRFFGDEIDSFILKDPYFLAAPGFPQGRNATDFLLLDLQPALRGAAYQYYIVRFRDDGEIDRVIRTNTVTVTP